MKKENQKNRRILLCVTGLSPQIVTETLYALAVCRDPVWLPDEIRVVTTAEGAQQVSLSLLHPSKGHFYKLLQDYGLPEIEFRMEHVMVVRDANGQPLSDIRSPADNERVADAICALVRDLTSDPGSELHVSIAGGRKTMGYYLGYALSLFGRTQDRLSHVLVTPQFESNPDFFYPLPPGSEPISKKDQSKLLLDPSLAEVTLAEIPFVRLRDGLDQRLLNGQAGFVETVQAAQQSLRAPSLVLDLPGQCVEIMGKRIDLPPRVLALYSVFARARSEGRGPLSAPVKGAADPEWGKPFLREYQLIRSNPMDDDTAKRKYAKGLDGDNFSQIKSKLHRALKEALGDTAAKAYFIDRGRDGFSLTLPRTAIHYRRVSG